MKISTRKIFLFFLFSQLLTACGENSKSANMQFPPTPVDAEPIKIMDIPVFSELTGRASAVRVADVRPQVSGVVLKRLFREGSIVNQGEQLYQIDPAIYEANLASAKAELSKAEASLFTTKLKYDRYVKLRESKSISEQDLDDASANYRMAQATLLVAKASVKTAEINLAYTKVYAPITGYISKSNFTEGALVTNGQQLALATIQQLDPIYVDLSQSAKDYINFKKDIKKGTFDQSKVKNVEIILETGDKYEHDGVLEFSEVSVDECTGTVNLRASVANPDKLLLPGMYVRGNIEEGLTKNAKLVPQIAVMRQNNGTAKFYFVDNKNCPPKVQSCVGLQNVNIIGEYKTYYIVDNDLSAETMAITSNIQKIGPGVPIAPIYKNKD
ncbi:MAG: efflux RND transporter periplasmic adaptor subunit [Succinivibrionaceae bacterium]